MRFIILCGACLLGAVVAGLSLTQAPAAPEKSFDNVAQTEARTPEEERKGFHLPPGFEIQLVASEPYIRKPININFDDRGRLWVTESVEYPFEGKSETENRDAVVILEDKNNDGLADEITTFTEGLNIPIGVLPVKNGALVYSIPYIYRFTDHKGDGRADQREVLYGTYGHKDTHGMTGEFTWGFDGWVYACHGFANTSEVKASDGSMIKMESGNTYRFKADGSHVEYWTHGQVNPFGLTFDPLGNLYSCDCETKPIYMLLRGGYYPSFGKPHDGLGFAPETMSYTHGPTAVAGIAYYAADHFPPAYRDSIFVGNVVSNRINHDKLEVHGSTYQAAKDADFLTSDDPWFRPVDIKVGPDGALYVADFYNRIIGHYEVPLTHPGRDHAHGRIWRIVYRGPDGKGPLPTRPRADWSTASVPELVQDLAHPNLTVRFKATNQLVERGGMEGVAAVREIMRPSSSPFQRMHGLWVLERQGALDETTLTAAAHDADRGVRVHAMRVLAERREWTPSLHQLVWAGLKDPDAFVKRAAAEALGTHPSADNLRPLLDLRPAIPADDTHLLYMVRMALRNQLQTPESWRQPVLASLNEQDEGFIADVAPGVPSAESAAYLMNHLWKAAETYENQVRYVYHIARYGPEGMAGRLLEYARGDRAASLKHRIALFKAMQEGTQARGGKLAPTAQDWAEQLARGLLSSSQESEVQAGIELCGTLKLEAYRGMLSGIAVDPTSPEGERVAALNALTALDPLRHISLLGRLLEDPAESFALREKAANVLAGINKPESQAELLKALPSAPERLAIVVATGLARSRPGADKLLETVAAGKASPRLLQEKTIAVALNSAKVPDLTDRLAKLTAGLPPADQRLHDLEKHRREAFATARTDPAKGMKVFEKNCALCHRIGTTGAKIGPQLDGIGLRGVDRLLEDVLDPNQNVDQAFRVTTLTLTDGQIVSGLVLREEGKVLVLADSQGKEVRVPKENVDEKVVSKLSPMPANFADQIPEGDFYNLLAFLLAQRPARENYAAASLGP